MRSLMKMSMLMAGAFVVSTGANAFASELDVKVPFPFVVNGTALPAGQYRVETEGTMVVIHGERGTHGGAVALTMTATGHDPAGTVPVLTFSRHENEVRLTGVWQSPSDGQTLIHR
jgi:hypothetical protein